MTMPILLLIFAYLLGSVPFGLLIARAHGIDLRTIGSGNIGATNVSRALGKKWAYVCFLLDVLKGLVPMLLARWLNIIPDQPATHELFLWLLVGCAAICGHIFPLWLKFKGGKGVATSLGVVLGVWPYFTFCGVAIFAVWSVCVLIWRYVSLASIIAAISFPIIFSLLTAAIKSWHLASLWPLVVIAFVMPLLVIARHTENIKRLRQGTESKILQKK
jgi:acyl phosphate:glycerol-3-phosphate acyltransferase